MKVGSFFEFEYPCIKRNEIIAYETKSNKKEMNFVGFLDEMAYLCTRDKTYN